MNAVLIGYGEIGKGIYDVFSVYHPIEVQDPFQHRNAYGIFEMMLVTIPYDKHFVRTVRAYQAEYKPQSTIIFSTVPVGTCSKLGAVHCPIEGKHPDLDRSIRNTDKWLGGSDDMANRFLFEAGFMVMPLDNPEHTEALKLMSTTKYGLNVEYARYAKKVCDKVGMDYEYVKAWDRWVNSLYQSMDMDWATRYVLDPPEGPKGGHCVTKNARLLHKQFPDKITKIVGEM
jgi:hypothetical protein